MAGGIKNFLLSLELGHYFTNFQTRGYDDEADIPHLNVSDLQTVGITNPMEIIVILKAAQSYKQSPEYELFRWLRDHGLIHYHEGFIQSDRIHLSDIAQLNLPDEDVYDELEITLPGHRRRLERAVNSLRKRQRPGGSEGVEEGVMVTEGWWGFPSYLPNAKFPFLCVKATMQSTREPESQQSIDFMVDSGSDVSTLREDIVQSLNLEPITTVRSFGAHGSARTTMYQAFIIIGNSKLEIEVIGSSYDSLGSRVLRHFNHRINGTRHKWYRASSTGASSHSTSGSRALSDSGEIVEPETVSVLPEQERGTPYSRIFQKNPGSSRTGGDGATGSSSSSYSDGRGGDGGGGGGSSGVGGPSFSQGGAASAKRDDTDSLLLPTWLSHPASPSRTLPQRNSSMESSRLASVYRNSADPSWSLSPQRRNTTDSPWSSPLAAGHHRHSPSSGNFNKRPRCMSDSTDRVYYPPDSFPRMSQERSPGNLADSSPPHPDPRLAAWTDQRGLTSPRTGQQSSDHQGGHVIFSGDGIISLSFGRDVRRKREREDAEGLNHHSDH